MLFGRRRKARKDMLELITGYWQSQPVFVAAKLGIADVLANGPMDAAAIAQRVGAHGPNLQRVLRALASVGASRSTQMGVLA